MARLESQAKMGYYPTPESTLQQIREKLVLTPGSVLLDPCCGEGDALLEISFGNTTRGVELDTMRAAKASSNLDAVLCGSIFEVIARPLESFSLLYLNPPYDWQKGERMEYLFLRQSHKWLMNGGLLVYLVPEHVLEMKKVRTFLSRRYTDISVCRFTREDYPSFKQAALFGTKQEKEHEASLPAPPYQHIEDTNFTCEVPQAKPSQVFELQGIRPKDIKAHRPAAIKNIAETVCKASKSGAQALSPLFPLRKGHLVSLLMSGVLNGELCDEEKKLVFKCFTERHQTTRTTDAKEITTDTYASGIRVIERGRWYDVM